MPSAEILGKGSSSYSEGIVIGEAFCDTHGGGGHIHNQLFFTKKNIHGIDGHVNFNLPGAGGVPLAREGFVRLGHKKSRDFWRIFNNLGPNDQTALKDLVAQMLALINLGGPLPAF